MNKYKHYHLIGIGGIGMSGIAKLLLSQNIKVSGSDVKESRVTQGLKGQGAEIFIGHAPANIKGADLIVYSSAVKEDNPEIVAAKQQGLPIIKRAQALAELMKEKTVVTVSGSHGKTTTTSLVAYLLLEAGFSPTIAVGGILSNIDNNAYWGSGDFFVAEADESDGSFLYYRPKYTIITNIDYEHLDYYKDFKHAVNAFREFLFKTREGGCVFCCDDDPNLKEILKDYKNKSVLFGFKERAQIYPKNIKMDGLSSQFDCFYNHQCIGRFDLALGGLHNISNALPVIALGVELGIGVETIKKGLRGYQGAKRRIEVKFRDKSYLVIDDYAHHPTEIKATLAAIKNLNSKRVIAVFQPHRYTRTKLLFEEFAKSFDLADHVIITDIYPACENPIAGVDAGNLCAKIKEYHPGKSVDFVSKEAILDHILKIVRPQDLVITLGAGDINKICDELAEKFKEGF